MKKFFYLMMIFCTFAMSSVAMANALNIGEISNEKEAPPILETLDNILTLDIENEKPKDCVISDYTFNKHFRGTVRIEIDSVSFRLELFKEKPTKLYINDSEITDTEVVNSKKAAILKHIHNKDYTYLNVTPHILLRRHFVYNNKCYKDYKDAYNDAGKKRHKIRIVLEPTKI